MLKLETVIALHIEEVRLSVEYSQLLARGSLCIKMLVLQVYARVRCTRYDVTEIEC